jgi:SAM-dependent methyltransferase
MRRTSRKAIVARQEHWETLYRTRGDTELSWFQAHPAVSLSLIESLRPAPGSVIDVGGGHSALAGALLARGIESVTVVDISSAAIGRGRERLGSAADRVRWIVADVLEAPDLGELDLWHDRAVFHFLTDIEDQRNYISTASTSVRPGGHAIVATFAPTGPEKCSGLPVCRYDAAQLARAWGESFELIRSATESHATPWGTTQDFTYVVLVRR